MRTSETTYPNSLTSTHISKAVRDSLDNGTTLIFSRLNLSDVGALASELASGARQNSPDQTSVERVALDHNRLTTLPTEFAHLSRLRYLNLRHNYFKVLPDVLTAIPSLDTLDISYNRIDILPPEPRQLINLRVLCLARNKIVRLPPYFSEFNNLEVLQIERNPIEWPPKHVIEPTGGLDSSASMQAWIRTLQRWLDVESQVKYSDYGQSNELHSSDTSVEEVYSKWKSSLKENPSPTAHVRSISMDSNFSVSYVPNSFKGTESLSSPESQHLPPPLHIGILGYEPSPTRSFESFTPSSANSESFQDNINAESNEQHVPSLIPESDGSHTNSVVKTDLAPSSHLLVLQRDSYLSRVSTIPISKTLPTALVRLSDSTRNILFALIEIYQAIERIMIYSMDERVSIMLRKVLTTASSDVFQLINALGHFDIISRKMSPSPAVCRAVVESCKDTVVEFNKAIGIFNLQLKASAIDDVRCSRWILLELYAAMAEISSAWRSLVPHADLIKSSLRPAKSFPPSSVPIPPIGLEFPLPTEELGSLDSPAFHRSQTLAIPISAPSGKVRTARRNAGSFSSKDVEIGRNMPSHDDPPHMSIGRIARGGRSHVPVLCAAKRQPVAPAASMQSSPTTLPTSTQLPTSKSTGFQNGLLAIIPDIFTDSQNQVDKEALQAIHGALEIAPLVCDMMEEVLADIMSVKPSVRDTIRTARVATMRLSDTVHNLENANTVLHVRRLREDAHAFLKGVVQLSNIVKTYAGLHTASTDLRINMIKLTSSTEEFAILLHVSSFTLTASESNVTQLNVSTTNPNSTNPDEKKIQHSLSRNQSPNILRRPS